jgi:hypothetical protein
MMFVRLIDEPGDDPGILDEWLRGLADMTLRFKCSCGQMLKAADIMAGARAKCLLCGRIIQIPYPEDAGAPRSRRHEYCKCARCGRSFPVSQMLSFSQQIICLHCYREDPIRQRQRSLTRKIVFFTCTVLLALIVWVVLHHTAFHN